MRKGEEVAVAAARSAAVVVVEAVATIGCFSFLLRPSLFPSTPLSLSLSPLSSTLVLSSPSTCHLAKDMKNSATVQADTMGPSDWLAGLLSVTLCNRCYGAQSQKHCSLLLTRAEVGNT